MIEKPGVNHANIRHRDAEADQTKSDPLRLAEILSNLLTNAAKYSDPGSHIDVVGIIHGDTLTLTVTDDGIGMAAEFIAGIFDMLSQVEGVLGRSDGGLGIGLALVKGLTELHGGTVEVRSAGLGCGSEFTVRLPLAIETDLTPSNVRTLDQWLNDPATPKVLVHCASSNRVGALLALRAHWLQGSGAEAAIDVGHAAGLTGLEPAVRGLLARSTAP
jgi:anti-sigma regulatory factor (Ser/Thr protein kinase)